MEEYEIIRGDEGVASSLPESFSPTGTKLTTTTPEFTPIEEETTGKYALRQATRLGARGFEEILGLPSNIIQGISSLYNLGLYALTGQASPVLANLPLPTSTKIKDYITKPIAETIGGKGYLDPQTKGEEIADDLAGDIATFLLPIKGKIPFKRALMTAGFGNLAKYAAKEIDLPEVAQEGLKLGTMLTVNFAGPKKLSKLAKELYTDARKNLPEGANVSAKPLRKSLDRLSTLVKEGDLPSNWTKKLTSVKKGIVNNKIPVEKVWNLSKDLNELHFDFKSKSAFKRAYPEVKEGINNTFKLYGRENPAFYTNLNEANSLHGALKNSKKVAEALEKNISYGKLGGGLGLATIGVLFGWYSPTTYLKGVATAGGVKAASIMASTMYQTLNVLKNSSTARKYYLKTIQEAVKFNKKAASHYARKLDDEFNSALEPLYEIERD